MGVTSMAIEEMGDAKLRLAQFDNKPELGCLPRFGEEWRFV